MQLAASLLQRVSGEEGPWYAIPSNTEPAGRGEDRWCCTIPCRRDPCCRCDRESGLPPEVGVAAEVAAGVVETRGAEARVVGARGTEARTTTEASGTEARGVEAKGTEVRGEAEVRGTEARGEVEVRGAVEAGLRGAGA